MWFAAVVHHIHRHVPKVLDCGERLIALGHEHGLPVYQTIGRIMHGWALVRLGRVAEGLPALRQAMSRYRATSRVMTAPPSPNGESLAAAIAASSSRTGTPAATGPNSSSSKAGIPRRTSVNTVGG